MQEFLGFKIKAVNTDNGSEFAKHFEETCESLTLKHYFTYLKFPKMNSLIERYNRTIQEEAHFPAFSEPIEIWNNHINHFLMIYNFYRPHFSLNYLSPVQKFLLSFHRSQKSNMLWAYTIYLMFWSTKV